MTGAISELDRRIYFIRPQVCREHKLGFFDIETDGNEILPLKATQSAVLGGSSQNGLASSLSTGHNCALSVSSHVPSDRKGPTETHS